MIPHRLPKGRLSDLAYSVVPGKPGTFLPGCVWFPQRVQHLCLERPKPQVSSELLTACQWRSGWDPQGCSIRADH